MAVEVRLALPGIALGRRALIVGPGEQRGVGLSGVLDDARQGPTPYAIPYATPSTTICTRCLPWYSSRLSR